MKQIGSILPIYLYTGFGTVSDATGVRMMAIGLKFYPVAASRNASWRPRRRSFFSIKVRLGEQPAAEGHVYRVVDRVSYSK